MIRGAYCTFNGISLRLIISSAVFPINWTNNGLDSSSVPECPWTGKHRDSETGVHLDREWIYMKGSNSWLTRLVQRKPLMQHETKTYLI